jgi:hypothetical protein
MSSNLRDETIPMAYSGYFSDNGNITNNLTLNSITNNSSSSYIDLGNILQEKKEWFEPPAEAKPLVINQFKKRKVKKKHRYEFSSYPIRTRKKLNQEESNQSINQSTNMLCQKFLLSIPIKKYNQSKSHQQMSCPVSYEVKRSSWLGAVLSHQIGTHKF